MDSSVQINVGLSKGNWVIRFEKISKSNKYVRHRKIANKASLKPVGQDWGEGEELIN